MFVDNPSLVDTYCLNTHLSFQIGWFNNGPFTFNYNHNNNNNKFSVKKRMFSRIEPWILQKPSPEDIRNVQIFKTWPNNADVSTRKFSPLITKSKASFPSLTHSCFPMIYSISYNSVSTHVIYGFSPQVGTVQALVSEGKRWLVRTGGFLHHADTISAISRRRYILRYLWTFVCRSCPFLNGYKHDRQWVQRHYRLFGAWNVSKVYNRVPVF